MGMQMYQHRMAVHLFKIVTALPEQRLCPQIEVVGQGVLAQHADNVAQLDLDALLPSDNRGYAQSVGIPRKSGGRWYSRTSAAAN